MDDDGIFHHFRNDKQCRATCVQGSLGGQATIAKHIPQADALHRLCQFPRYVGARHCFSGTDRNKHYREMATLCTRHAEEYGNENFSSENFYCRVASLHERVFTDYKTLLQGEHQLLTRMMSFWEYLLPDMEKRLRKRLSKSRNVKDYTEAVNLLFSLVITSALQETVLSTASGSDIT